MGKSLEQKQREYELTVSVFERVPVDNDFVLGYAVRVIEELSERGYDTLARRLQIAIRPYRRKWSKKEDDPNDY